jgi:hypothetical protein
MGRRLAAARGAVVATQVGRSCGTIAELGWLERTPLRKGD